MNTDKSKQRINRNKHYPPPDTSKYYTEARRVPPRRSNAIVRAVKRIGPEVGFDALQGPERKIIVVVGILIALFLIAAPFLYFYRS